MLIYRNNELLILIGNTAEKNLKLQYFWDRIAIGLSFLCAIHCLLMPIAILLLPSFLIASLQSELFHLLMFFTVLPNSIYALFTGYRKHKNIPTIVSGVIGLVLLSLATILGHESLGELSEKILLLFASCMIAFVHIRNYQQCKQAACDC